MPFNDNTNIPVLIIWDLVVFGFLLFGRSLLRTPAETMLQSDRRTGYWIYQSELNRSGDEGRAIAKAATFYKWFAYFMIGIAAIHLCVVNPLLAYKLWIWLAQ